MHASRVEGRSRTGHDSVKYFSLLIVMEGRDSLVGIVNRHNEGKVFRPTQPGPGTHPASYTMGTVTLPEGKAARGCC